MRNRNRTVDGHPSIDTPLIKFSSLLIKLEYHVNLSCLHLHRCATVTAIPKGAVRLQLHIQYGGSIFNRNGAQI
jgi:hypothetical protein